jgi:site-specific recombinase XerD
MVKRCNIVLPRGQCTHVLRHTFASHFMMNGGNILALKEILGHTSLNMTMRYAHLSPEYLKDAVRLNPLSMYEGESIP